MGELISSWTISEGLSQLKQKVIAKGNKLRAEYFVQSFLKKYQEETESKIKSNELDVIFDKISSSEVSKDLLFETYRKVCLSSSKKLGPKIMGILSAKICLEDRIATPTEELIFETCQALNDLELRSIVMFFDSIEWMNCGQSRYGRFPHNYVYETADGKKHTTISELGLNETKYLYEIQIGSTSLYPESDYDETVTAPSIQNIFGRWAVKLKNLDILIERTTEEHEYQEDEHYQTTTERKFYADLNREFVESILPLINRATGPL